MRKWLRADNLEKDALTLLLAAMTLLMLAAAACRHLAPHHQPPILAAAAACLAWLASFGMARAATLGLHVRVSFVTQFVSLRWRKRLILVADIAFLLFAVFSFAVGLAVLVASLEHHQSPGHPLVYSAIPVGSLLTIVRLFQRLRRLYAEDVE